MFKCYWKEPVYRGQRGQWTASRKMGGGPGPAARVEGSPFDGRKGSLSTLCRDHEAHEAHEEHVHLWAAEGGVMGDRGDNRTSEADWPSSNAVTRGATLHGCLEAPA